MPALLFGSISTLADTSERQRAAFNQAFSQHGAPWQWDRDEYRTLLTSNGGAARIAGYARARGVQVDSDALHAAKSDIFQRNLAGDATVQARPGVAETIAAAREQGWQVGLVTTTSPENIAALLGALDGQLSRDDFDVIVDRTEVDDPKPAPAAYEYALSKLGMDPAEAVAVEDNVGGVRAAAAAGIGCLAFPNENTAGHDFGDARVVDRIDLDTARAAVARA